MDLKRAILALAVGLLPLSAMADPLRLATWNPGLTRKGPGLLMRDIAARQEQVVAAARVVTHHRPDAIVLTGFDWDLDGRALAAFADLLAEMGHPMPHRFAARPNSGAATGRDLDGNGRAGEARDSQGYGDFTGQAGMAILSRWPIGPVADHSAALWAAMPGNRMPPGPDADIRRLSSTAHWDAVIAAPDGPVHLLAMSATPPAFEPINIPRNHDELAFWLDRLPDAPFAVIGNLNIDPADGDGDAGALRRLMAHVTDPEPRAAHQPPQDGPNAGQRGDPALDTARYDRGPGNLRLDYILPAKGLRVTGAGVFWPAPDDPMAEAADTASHRRLVWTDLELE